jgi:hypothetical protein
MNCPTCGTQNPDDAQVCTSCSAVLNPVSKTTEEITTKTSGLAIAALVLGILSLFSCGITAIPAIILGIISYVNIEKSGGRLTGRGFAVQGIGISVVALFLLGTVVPALIKVRSPGFRMVCGANLSGLGRAMLIYANDYDNQFPRAGGPTTKWGATPDWQAENQSDAFGLKPDGTGGSATISSSLYLLVKYAEVTPKSFCCKQDPGIRGFLASDYTPHMEDEDAWDFGPEPSKHCSYSYHMCYGPYPLSTESSEPGMAVLADRNPWLDPYTDTTGFKWDDQTMTGGRENIKRYQKGNTGPHKREGQNVLFMDNHVYFEKQSFCGVDDDNIYTYWNGSDIRQGAPPVMGSQPANRLDSLLVNEQPKEDKK